MGGASLLVKNHTLPQLLSKAYPENAWNTKSFAQVTDMWTDEKTASYLVERLKKHRSEVSFLNKMIKSMDYKELFPLTKMLKENFPEYSWQTQFSPVGNKKHQYMLRECIGELFSGENSVLLEEYRHPEINSLQLDYFFPQKKLAFEYQVFIFFL